MMSTAGPKRMDPGGRSERFTAQFYVVTLIDFLGQKAELTKWDSLPITDSEERKFDDAIQKSFGKVLNWREEFEKNYNLWFKAKEPKLRLEDLSPDDARMYRESSDTSLDFMHFSDTIIVYSLVSNRYGYPDVGAVLGHLYACGILMLSALNRETVFRGAIEIGMGAQFKEADIYGPVLADAHRLESKQAEYPRILVGPRLLGYLDGLASSTEETPSAHINRGAANWCMKLLGADTDGKCIVDYLNDGFSNWA
ncbi:MAG: hypothetical protein WBE26_04635 [Phycisphaerae bacterium]